MAGEVEGAGRRRAVAQPGAGRSGSASGALVGRHPAGAPRTGRRQDGSQAPRLRQRSPQRVWLRLQLPRLGWRQQLSLFFIFSLVLIIAMVTLRPWVSQLGGWGYGGAFLISLLSNATIIFPAPGAAIIIMMAQDYHPLLLGIVTGLGGALGALTAYLAGVVGGQAMHTNRFYKLGSRAMGRVGGLLIFSFSLLPFLPMDAASILAGGIRYPFRRYLFWMGLAHVLKMTALTYSAASSFEWVRRWLQPLG